MERELRICRKCLIRETEKEEYFRTLRQYIDALEEDARVSPGGYRERLSLCGSCEKIRQEMCTVCGCYVEFRAAQKVRKCPDIPPRWLPEE